MWSMWVADFIYKPEHPRNLKRAPLRCACKKSDAWGLAGSGGDFPLKVEFEPLRDLGQLVSYQSPSTPISRTPSWGHSADQRSRQGVQQTSKSKRAIDGYLAHLLLGYTLIVNRFHVGLLNVHSCMSVWTQVWITKHSLSFVCCLVDAHCLVEQGHVTDDNNTSQHMIMFNNHGVFFRGGT